MNNMFGFIDKIDKFKKTDQSSSKSDQPPQNIDEKIEKRELLDLNQKEIWIIDDDKNIVEACLRLWEFESKGSDYQFNHFDKAKDAIEELKRRIENKEKLPGTILVDGYLDLDDEELNSGPLVVNQIKKLVNGIKIIGFSSSEAKNEEMMEAGAETAFRKTEAKLVGDYLKKQAEQRQELENQK